MNYLVILLLAVFSMAACNPLTGELDGSYNDEGFHPGYISRTISMTDMPLLVRGGETLNVAYTLPSEITSAVLEFSIDGTTYTTVSSLNLKSYSYIWAVPSLNSALASLKITTANKQGLSSTVSSRSFTIDSIAPAAPSLTITSANPSSSLTVNASVASCADRAKILISSSSVAPSFDAAGWVSCAVVGVLTQNLSPGEGTRILYGFAQDAAGNVSAAQNLSLVVDTVAPSVAFTAAPTSASKLKGADSFALTFTASDATTGLSSLQLSYASDGSTFTALTPVTVSTTSFTFNIPNDNTAAAKLKLVATDGAGQVTTVTTPAFMIDSVAPSLTLTAPSGSYRGGDVYPFSFSASDATSGLTSLKLQYAALGSSFVDIVTLAHNATSYAWTIPSDDSALAKVRLIAVDAAGNSATITSSAFTIDSAPPAAPSISLSSANPTTSLAATLTVATCTDRTKIFISQTSTAPAFNAAGWVACSTVASAHTLTLSAGDGTKTIYAFAQDSVGNVSTAASLTTVLDTVAPALTFTTAPSTVSMLKGGSTYALAWSSSDATSGIASLKLYYAADGSTFVLDTTLANSATSLNWTVPTATNLSTAKLKLVAIDGAGQVTENTTSAFSIDSTAPALTMSSPTSAYRGGDTYGFTVSASDALSAMSTLVLQYAANGTTFSDIATLTNTATSYSWTLPTANVSTAKVRLVGTDTVGNQTIITSSAFTIDSTAPTAPSITIASATPTNSTAAAFTVGSCTDRTKIFISETSTAPAFDAAGWQNCVTTAGAITDTLSAGDGTKSLYSFAQDAVGNVSTATPSSIVVDTVAPTLTLTSHTGGQIVSGVNTNSVTWTAADAASGLKTNSAKIEVSSDGGSTYSNVATSQATAGPYPWNVGGGINSDTYRLKVTVSDAAGNLTSAVSAANFTIDSSLPTLTSSEMTVNGTVTGASTITNYVNISFKAADHYTKITHFCLKYNDTTPPDATAVCWAPVSAAGQVSSTALTVSNYSFGLGMGTSLYHVYAWVKDQAMNVSSMSTTDGKDHVSINYTSPSPPTITRVMGTTVRLLQARRVRLI